MDKIPAELVGNFNPTAINYVPKASWTMEKENSRRMEIISHLENIIQKAQSHISMVLFVAQYYHM